MSRADQVRAKYEAELAVVDLEDQLAAAKAEVGRCPECGRRERGPTPELNELKDAVREARRLHRLEREGGAVAAPEVVQVSADVASPGGAE